MKLAHRFVELIPDELEDGVLYVSIKFGTVVHKCACGCGEEVVTPLGPAEWRLTYDGRTVSLAPSIGNWSFPCRSHYWIERGSVRWARGFSGAEVAKVRQDAKARRESYYVEGIADPSGIAPRDSSRAGANGDDVRSFWQWVQAKFGLLFRRQDRGE